MKVTYVKHSCFTVELAKEYKDLMPSCDKDRHVVLIFDYYQGEIPEFPKDSSVYVFVSHKHADHYNQSIFKLADTYENIVFFLAKEIRMNEKYMERCNIPIKARDKILYAHANKEYELSNITSIQVKTYKSTDSGVAYLISYAGKKIYHAGDLNWWKTEIPQNLIVPEPEMIKMKDAEIRMETNFKKETAFLSEEDCIDVAFLPLDGRLGKYAGLGFTHYMQHCNIKKAYPMHMWENYGLTDKYKDSIETEAFADKIVNIHRQGETFLD